MFTPSKRFYGTTFFNGLLISLLSIAFLAACATAPRTVDDRGDLRRDADSALSKARSESTGFDSIIRSSAGYAVFPTVGKGGLGLGGAYGRGIVYANGRQVGYTDVSQGTVGAQIGGQTYTQILVFENAYALDRFREGNYEFSAQATAVALRSGEGVNAEFKEGVAVFTMAEKGLMAEAVVGGQKFSYQPFTSR